MTSREEREEIAKKLREGGIARNEAEAYVLLLHCIGIRPQLPAVNTYKLALERLVDLIDPTCKYLPITCATWFDDNDEEHEDTSLEALGNSENAYCSFCGYEMMTGEEGWFDYERKEHGNRLIPLFNYCPDCGARVVRDNHD